MRDATSMPELREDASARAVNSLGDFSPTCNLFIGVHPRRKKVPASFDGDLRTLHNDEPRRSALAVVKGGLLVGNSEACTRPGHWRHDHSVRQGQSGEVIRLEKGAHNGSPSHVCAIGAARDRARARCGSLRILNAMESAEERRKPVRP